MNELEDFIIELNSIEKDKVSDLAERAHKLADYLFSSPSSSSSSGDKKGWHLLTALYARKIELNSIFGEKLNDLLLSNFIKLYVHLDPSLYSASPQSLATDLASLFEDHLACDSLVLNESSSGGNLFAYLVICLTLWLRLNDGATNAQHLFTHQRVLNQLTDVLFPSAPPPTLPPLSTPSTRSGESCELYRLVYLKFLDRLCRVNLRNMTSSRRSTGGISSSSLPKEASKHVLLEQFDRLVKANKLSERERTILLSLVVNYLSDFFGYVCVPSLTSGVTLASASGFDGLVVLVRHVAEFVFDELARESVDVDAGTFVNACNKLTTILAEMKHFKNA